MTQTTRKIEFLYPLSEELEDRLRVSALRQKNGIVKFVVQYEALIKMVIEFSLHKFEIL